jgi:hypothetical protein
MSETNPVAEIVTFRLVTGSDPAEFVNAARAVEPLLQATGQVLSRTLSQGEDGIWTDHITWASMAAAAATANAMMADPVAAPMMRMIDPAHVQMRHAPVVYQMA